MADYQLGPCEIIDNTSGRSLGKTQGGVSLKIEETTVTLHTDQDGETPVDEVITGTTATLEANLAEITLENLAFMLKTNVASNQVKIGPNVGTSLFTNARELCIVPYVQGVPTTDIRDKILIPKAGIKATPNMNYNSKDQRVIAFTATGFPDSSLSGNPGIVFGASNRASVGV